MVAGTCFMFGYVLGPLGKAGSNLPDLRNNLESQWLGILGYFQ